jgi:hypothetical protein
VMAACVALRVHTRLFIVRYLGIDDFVTFVAAASS